MKLKVAKVAEFISAQNLAETSTVSSSFAEAIAQGYSIDSRTVGAGEVFFAVKGERFDGHDFVQLALEKGAVAAVIRSDQL